MGVTSMRSPRTQVNAPAPASRWKVKGRRATRRIVILADARHDAPASDEEGPDAGAEETDYGEPTVGP